MAAEFYRKSTALYEEFKKRELHYLNVERNCNISSLSNDINLPLEAYLERISRRERETERSFRNLIENLEVMDKQTDEMSLKLEKLNALRDISVVSNITRGSGMSSTIERMHNEPYFGSAFMQNASFYPTNERRMPTYPTFDYPLQKTDSRSESTQTDHIFCNNCHYPVTSNKIADPVTELNTKENINTEHIENVTLPLNQNYDIYKDLESSMNQRGISNVQQRQTVLEISESERLNSNDKRDSLGKNTSKVGAGITPNLPSNSIENKASIDNVSHYLPNSGISAKETTSIINDHVDQTEKHVSQNSTVVAPNSNNLTKVMDPKESTKNKNEEIPVLMEEKTEFSNPTTHSEPRPTVPPSLNKAAYENTKQSNPTTHNDLGPSAPTSPNKAANNNHSKTKILETAASKSDDESINHEFDFLESNRRPSMKNKIVASESLESSVSDGISDTEKKDAEDEKKLISNPIETNSQTKNSVKPQNVAGKNVLASGDAAVESSLSEGSPSPALRSADASNPSESDSSSEKETPFSASAAYQALLGNAAPKPAKKAPTPSDSESEDEIEHVLATAVRRTSKIDFSGIIQAQKKEEKKASVPDITAKTDKKTSKPATAGISQTKLSKNTRKVLGLETSSGSEVEVEAKPNAKKIEEDSDEFDFYN